MENGSVKDESLTIGFYGGGMMAGSILEGLLTKNVIEPSNVCVCELLQERRDKLEKLKVNVTDDATEMLSFSKVVILALKPSVVPSALSTIIAHESIGNAPSNQLFISICAGVKLELLSTGNKQRKCIRVMPNLPCVVGAAASAYANGKECTTDDEDMVKLVMGACGEIFQLDEHHLDAVTGLSGSGPAFVFMMIEAMTDGGVRKGLPRSIAQGLAVQTVYGAAKMLKEDDTIHPARLRNLVESPGGTTISGTQVLEERGLRGAVIGAVEAATNRSVELGKK